MATVLIAGGTGLIGLRLSQLLEKKGYGVSHLSRGKNENAAFPTYKWDPQAGSIDGEAIRQADYIINLAGAGIADKSWTAKRKKIIIDSRVKGNLLIKESIEKLGLQPKAYLSAAGMGYYGDRGDDWMKETDKPSGKGFLSTSCMEWEDSILEVAKTGIRTVHFRIGIVLSTRGGALEKLLLPFKFRVGGYFGSGKQWYSWIHLDDICRLFIHALENEDMEGVYNGASPNPLRNKEFTRRIMQAIEKPSLLLPGPEIALRAAFGEMADTILGSTRLSAEKVLGAGFEFEFPELIGAVQDLVKRGM